GQVIGSRFPRTGGKCPKIACFQRKLGPVSRERSQPCHPISVRSSSCVTLRDGRRKKPVTSSEYLRAISGCFSTAHGRRYATCLQSISRKSRSSMTTVTMLSSKKEINAMTPFAMALPLLPGKTEDWRRWTQEIAGTQLNEL